MSSAGPPDSELVESVILFFRIGLSRLLSGLEVELPLIPGVQ